MIRSIIGWGLMSLGVLAVSSSGGSFFDGSGGPVPEIKIIQTAPAARSHAVRSNVDLFYFTPEEAQEALRNLGTAEEPPTGKGYVFEANVPAHIQKQMRDDLAFLNEIHGREATPLHQEIFGPVDGPTYMKFFNDRVTAIGMHSCGGGNAVACVMPWKGHTKMWLTENFVKFSHPQVARMMVVFHEARHTEKRNSFWQHATCPKPFLDENGNVVKSIWTGAVLAGETACDDDPFGSYGSSTIMLKNISMSCTNCTDKVKMDASLYAEDQLGRIIDAEAKEQMRNDFKK